MARCRSCDATIVWARTRNGKNIPVEPEPSERGNIMLKSDGRGGQEAIVFGSLEAIELQHSGRLLHASHFAVCPNASQHRGGRHV